MLGALLLGACATQPAARDSLGADIAQRAIAELGRRYRYGGDDAAGFDCSGLALAVHARAGIVIPRTAAAQFARGAHVKRSQLRPGDLLFFRFSGRKIDHVGVYIGDGEFVHAPGAGDIVRRAQLTAPWFEQRYAGAASYWRD